MLVSAGVKLDGPEPGDLHKSLRVMRRFSEVPIVDVDMATDGDMILAQYGTYDWGRGEYFEVDVTRQLMPQEEDADEDDDNIHQLRCVVRFAPTEELRALGSFERWLVEGEGDAFWEAILATDGFTLDDAPQEIEVLYERV